MTEKIRHVLIIGEGRIGTALKKIFQEFSDMDRVQISHVDKVQDTQQIEGEITDVFACVPYTVVEECARVAITLGANFYDFTESEDVKINLRETFASFWVSTNGPAKSAYVGGCGVAPGIINMIAGELVRNMSEVHTLDLYCGGIPQSPGINTLNHSPTWSVQGLWNLYFREKILWKQYGVIEEGVLGSGYEAINDINGVSGEYEAFLTGGGTGNLLKLYPAISTIRYRTIRHRGHLEKVMTLNKLLKLYLNSHLFESIMNTLAVPNVSDMVLIKVIASGRSKYGDATTCSKGVTIYSRYGLTAMQYATALGGFKAFQYVTAGDLTGIVHQEYISY